MEALETVSPVPIGFEDVAGDALGYYHLVDKRIAIQEDMSQLQTMKTAIHEIAHAVLHDRDSKREADLPSEKWKDRHTKEVEAESVAYTICKHYGLDTSNYSFEYIAGWSSDRELPELKSSLNTIRSTSSSLITEIDTKMQELLKESDIEQENRIEGLSSEEAALVYGHSNYFGIYQLKEDDDNVLPYRFTRLEYLNELGLAVERANYNLVYREELPEWQSLDGIFEQFNFNRPENFEGHSLSVSDIVVLRKDGKTKAYYVDAFGFEEVPDFYQNLNKEVEISEVAYDLGDRYIAVQEREGGYEYDLIDSQYKYIDGGILENPDITIQQAAKEIVTDLYGDVPMLMANYEDLVEKAEAENAITSEAIQKKLDDIYLRREQNPLTKVEEQEEANYNQIDGVCCCSK